MLRPAHSDLFGASWRATVRVIRAASGVYVILFAVLGVLLARPWREGGTDAIAQWLVPIIGPVVLLVGGSFLYHLAQESWGRWRLRPSWGYGDGQWFLWIHRRGPEAWRRFKCTVRDDLGGATEHDYKQWGAQFADLFPGQFDVSGMKAGRKAPWGRYEVTWEMFEGEKRRARCRFAFDWPNPLNLVELPPL